VSLGIAAFFSVRQSLDKFDEIGNLGCILLLLIPFALFILLMTGTSAWSWFVPGDRSEGVDVLSGLVRGQIGETTLRIWQTKEYRLLPTVGVGSTGNPIKEYSVTELS